MAPPPGLGGATQGKTAEVDFANYISAMTGIDPRVILAQAMAEGNPGDYQDNWLNIESASAAAEHVPYTPGAYGIAKFSNWEEGAKASVDIFRGLGLTHEKGKSISQQITDIGDSGWASSHYGSPPGEHILQDFQSLYPNVDVGSIATTKPANAAFGGNTQPQSLTTAAGNAAGGLVSGLTSGITSLVYQGFFIVIGIGLILVGLGLVAWTLMGRVGAPGIIGMAQQQMRINQATRRTEESQRASMVREGQAQTRLGGQAEQRQLASRRLAVAERRTEQRSTQPVTVSSYSVQERVVMGGRNRQGKGKPTNPRPKP